ncbi:MAG TPA: YIP1 family protein [Longimicrobium sp.]|nr:YIP1 family protein [Longimicrobium sp.]
MSTSVLETAAHSPPAAPPRPAPLASRIADTLFSPGKVFEQFREGAAPWVAPIVVSLVVMVALLALRPLFISNREVAEFTLQHMRELGQQNPPSVEQVEQGIVMQSVFGAVGLAFWMFLRVIVAATLLAGIYGLLMGGNARFGSYLAVASHAFLVSTLGSIVLTGMQYASGQLDLMLDATLLMGDDPGAFLSALGHVLNPFGVWLIVLLALGGAVVNRRQGWAGAAAILAGLQFVMFFAVGLLTGMLTSRAG